VIRYNLACNNGHEFEAWFRSSADFDRAAAAGEASCPVCGSTAVDKAIMAPALAGTKKKGEKVSLAAPDPRSQAMREALREFRKKVTENADYVGDRFAEEARKIHYEESEPRGIYGEATSEEARDLAEEGIGFHPLPTLPEDTN
jgi:hypothetical protein